MSEEIINTGTPPLIEVLLAKVEELEARVEELERTTRNDSTHPFD